MGAVLRCRVFTGLAVAAALAAAVSAAEPARRCIVVEVFARAGEAGDDAALEAAEMFAADRPGLVVVRRFPDVSADDRAALAALAARHGFAAGELPAIHACGHAFAGAIDADAVARRLAAALRAEVFVRPGCGRCVSAKAWLPGFAARYPALAFEEHDVAADPAERDRLRELVRMHRMAAASLPAFHLAHRLVIGFDKPETTGARIEELLASLSRPCPESIGTDPGPPPADPAAEETIDVPLLGRLDAARLGMPLFTLAVGLVDGFNPCAMWVLLLLLSILVNLQDRLRILAVAGTFIAISGLAYFAFMAAWLTAFEWIGCLRPVQIILGTLAVGIGLVHVKDFVARGRGPSLSIPAAAKPGIYARIRRIVTAENLPAAVAGAVVLAVLVNLVELLCTAGLPALYTSVLAGRGFPAVVRYGYLGLYIAAYMFDDSLMVAGVVATLRQCRLQEAGGRWLKLVSGGVILGLGLVMLLRPEWLG
jgi:hypothetical protein